MPPRVLMFCPQFRPIVGGAERQAEKLARALIGRGVDVTVLTPWLDRAAPESELDGGLPVRRFPLFDLCKTLPGLPGLGPLNLVSLSTQIRRALSQYLPTTDIVHAHVASPLTAFAMRAAQHRGVPVLCKVAMAGERTDLRELEGIGLGGGVLARAMIARLDCWVATTAAVRESLLAMGVRSERIAAIPNGVEVDPYPPSHHERPVARRFLYLGRLSSNIQRDVRTLILAFERTADTIADAELAIVGDGDLAGETASMVSRSRHRARISMPGQQAPEPWLDWADCFILPSRREGLSNALLEAMASGIACLANDIPANREVLEPGEAGILVPVGDVDRLAVEMSRVCTIPGEAARLGRKAWQRVRTSYSIESVADQYRQLYAMLVGKVRGEGRLSSH